MYLSKITHNPKVLKRYSQFESKLELKQSVRKHIKKIKDQDMRADRKQGLIDVTMLLFSMSKKIIGVSWMCYKTMAKRLKVSDKTIQRRIDQLVKLGIIGKMSARRSSDKMRTSNVLYFVKCPNMNSSSFYSKKNLNDIEHKQKDKQNKFCNMIPKHSVENIYHFFKTKAELIGVKRNIDFCFKKSGYELNTYEQKIAIIKALHVLKSTKKIINKVGLFAHALKNVLKSEYKSTQENKFYLEGKTVNPSDKPQFYLNGKTVEKSNKNQFYLLGKTVDKSNKTNFYNPYTR